MDKIQREKAFNDREHAVRGRESSAQKTQHTGKFDLRSNDSRHGLKRWGLLDGANPGFYLGQCAAQMRCKTVRQQTECLLGCGAIPTGNTGSWGLQPFISAMAGETTAAAGMHRTDRKSCIDPLLFSNVLLAGASGSEPKLHRPSARTSSSRGGPPPFRWPSINPV